MLLLMEIDVKMTSKMINLKNKVINCFEVALTV